MYVVLRVLRCLIFVISKIGVCIFFLILVLSRLCVRVSVCLVFVALIIVMMAVDPVFVRVFVPGCVCATDIALVGFWFTHGIG